MLLLFVLLLLPLDDEDAASSELWCWPGTCWGWLLWVEDEDEARLVVGAFEDDLDFLGAELAEANFGGAGMAAGF